MLPSYWEGLPLTILEAMRLGVVVCASNVGAIAEVVQHQQDGLIIKNEQKGLFVQEAIDLLQGLISDRLNLMQLSKSAVLKASELNWDYASLNLRTKLKSLIAAKTIKSNG